MVYANTEAGCEGVENVSKEQRGHRNSAAAHRNTLSELRLDANDPRQQPRRNGATARAMSISRTEISQVNAAHR